MHVISELTSKVNKRLPDGRGTSDCIFNRKSIVSFTQDLSFNQQIRMEINIVGVWYNVTVMDTHARNKVLWLFCIAWQVHTAQSEVVESG